uniref:Uncharacterized protein n=1 Tax=Brassica oleracea var. oleracea TaxID=109376 RepID=A0A0D3CFG4_BRAOL
MPKIDVARLNAVRPQAKPSDNPPEATSTHSDDAKDPMEVDRVPMGRTLSKRNEKVVKHLKRGATEKEMESFQKRVLRIPIEKPFEEAYFTHILWMFFRETRETEEDIRRMFCGAREKMKKRITLKKKSDPEKFAIPCTVKGIEFPHALCNTTASVNILPRIISSGGIIRDLEVQIEACGKGTRFSRINGADRRASINREIQESIDRANNQSVDDKTSVIDRHPSETTIHCKQNPNYDNQYLTQDEFGIFRDPDGYARAIDDGHAMHVSREEIAEILQIINGVDNLFMQQHIVPSHQRMVMAVHLRKREGRGRWTSKASRVHRRFKLIRPFKDKGGTSLIHSVFGQAVKAKHLREFSVQDLACVQAVVVKLFKMEGGMKMKVAVTFKGSNYLVWSRMVKNAVGSKGLWKHITSGEAPMAITQGGLIVKLELSITLIEMLG